MGTNPLTTLLLRPFRSTSTPSAKEGRNDELSTWGEWRVNLFLVLSINFIQRFLSALQDEEAVSGRSLIFTIPKKEKEKKKSNLVSFRKKIEKKEKRIKTLAQSVKNTFAEQEKIIKKRRITKKKYKIKSKKRNLNYQWIKFRQVENLYHWNLNWLN